MIGQQLWRTFSNLYKTQQTPSGTNVRKFRMRSCCIVTLPMVAAILFSGLLTTHASAKAVVGKRSANAVSINDFKNDFLAQAELLKAKAAAEEEEEAARNDLELEPIVSGRAARFSAANNKIFQLIRDLSSDESQVGFGNVRLLQALLDLQQQREANENEMKKKHKPWEKRLEALANADSSAPDLSLLEARRRGGPEFNPTGW